MRVEKLSNLPYPAMLVPLTVFFAAKDSQEVPVTDRQREELVHWFWRSCFSRRFSSAVLRNLKRDLTEARKLRVTGNPALAEISVTIGEDWFLDNRFTIGAVNTRTFVLMLAQLGPESFVSGAPVDLGSVLKGYNRAEFHHLYPRSYLIGLGRSSDDINRLANFAFLSAADNKTLGGVAPSVYKAKMDHARVAEVLASAACPWSLFEDNYDAFLKNRATTLLGVANGLANL